MTSFFHRFRPRRIASQLAVVVGVSVVLIQIIVVASFFLLRPAERVVPMVHAAALVRFLSELPAGDIRRDRVVEMDRAFPELRLVLSSSPPAASVPLESRDAYGPMLDDVGRWVKDIREVRSSDGGGSLRLVFGLPGGEWVTLDPLVPPLPPLGPFGGGLIAGIAFAAISSVLLAVWAAHGLVRPLRALAGAAREFDIEGKPSPLPVSGPEEVRVASRAFDAMRDRIRDLVEDRTRMLAAMGHDLRTPITRLRLRCEFVADETLKAEILRDLGLMNDMIEGALTYLREGRHREPIALVDLGALLGTLCDSAGDRGCDVAYEGPVHLARRFRPQAMTRALSNLIDNAVKFGSVVRVRLSGLPAGVVVEIEDDGPGIAPEDRPAMLRPFVRGDVARNLDDAPGFGLGLAIAKAVVEGHGGTLTLATAPAGGLSVRIDLPI